MCQVCAAQRNRAGLRSLGGRTQGLGKGKGLLGFQTSTAELQELIDSPPELDIGDIFGGLLGPPASAPGADG